jgi:hypothetical protein
LIFFLLSFGGRGRGERIFFIFLLSPTCSIQVSISFPMCSLKVFPIAPCFNPICFAQSPPLLTYIGGPKEETLHLSIESSTCFCNRPIKLAHCQKKKKKFNLRGIPKLINIKQNKYPRIHN